MKVMSWEKRNLKKISEQLLRGEVVVIPTDTLYGLLAIAHITTVNRVYQLKGRSPSKPVIILISDFDDLGNFEISLTDWQERQLTKYWPGKVSVILPCETENLEFLHRGTKSLAFRLPTDPLLKSLLELTGPLIAPSANPEGLEPALDVKTAQEYFGEQVQLYVDGGVRHSDPSTLVSLIDDEVKILRGQL